MSAILDYFRYVGEQLTAIRFVDVLDILLVAFVFYYIFQFMRKRRAGKLLAGIVLLIVLLLISEVAQMKAMNFILTNVFSVGILSIIIVFQPELRSFLEKVGGTTFFNLRGKFDNSQEPAVKTMLSQVGLAAEHLSKSKTGALIVFERDTKLGDQAKTGTYINAEISSDLLENIFFNKSPLHDGAVIVSAGRLHSAGCLLPLSGNTELVRELGTRHRAGIGMSENSDAVVLIISEETGIISVAVDGELKRGFNRDTLEEYLYLRLAREDESADKMLNRIKGGFFRKGGKKNHEN